MRVKAETSDKELSEPSSSASGATTSEIEIGEIADANEAVPQSSHSEAQLDAHSLDVTLFGDSSSNTSREASSTNLKKTKPLALVVEGPAAASKPRVDTKNVLGKITNLISGDLQAVMEGKEALRMVIQTPIQITLGTLFLYNILGWR